MEASVILKKTPIYERHVALGAKMVEFAGYEMPIQYEGIIAEHEAVRNNIGIFDLTHMGEIEVTGPKAVAFVNRLVTNDVGSLDAGGILYTCILKEDGGILDDALVYMMLDRIMLVVNASNKNKIWNWINSLDLDGVHLADLSDEISLIAVQGPESEKLVAQVTSADLPDMEYYTFEEAPILGVKGIVSRTGYTGEDGFELYIKNEQALELWDTLMEKGKAVNLKPIGLGARDTLRLEAKYALYGNELGENINPLEAGLKWVVKMDSGFIGKDAIMKVEANKPNRKLVGFEMIKPGIPRHGYKVFSKEGAEIGYVTSGTHSPTLKKSIGLALVINKGNKIGEEIAIEIRGRKIPAVIIKTPFYTGSVKSKKKTDK